MIINFEPTRKQDEIFDCFDDELTTEILYGGSAGGGKSFGICALIILKCLQYPGIRIGLARNELTTLKKTTVVSFFEVADLWGVTSLFQYNSTSGVIKFNNGSEVILIELSYKPSDPLFNRLGGQLLTFGVIDEVTEIDEKGFNIFQTRLGRWKNDDLGIKPICIMTCNPSKNWVYKKYYRPYADNELKPYQVFIPALVTDNPFISDGYIENLRKLPFNERERMLNGNWDYEDNPNDLMTYSDILNIWDNVGPILEDNRSKRYITADIAFTSDKMVIMVWDNLTIIDILVNPEGIVENVILDLANKYGVPNQNIAYDSDGVGQFLKKRITNGKPIVNNAKALNKENYKNLKTQLYFKLAECVNNYTLKINGFNKYQNEIMEELSVVRYKPTQTVSKLEIIDKGEIKRLIGRSPDFSDAMAYRMYFEYKVTGVRTFTIR